MQTDCIRVVGARTHNLKNIDVAIPKDAMVVITGRSGSGKSSLAIDTLFAEGQRQYIESLSLGSRQRLDQAVGVDVDRIEGLQPTICINQSRGVPNPRSTVGTLSEIYDYLRLLYSKVGEIRCPECSSVVAPKTVEQIAEYVTSFPASTKIMLLAPIVVGADQRHEQVLEQIRKERLIRVRVSSEIFDIDQLPESIANSFDAIEAVTDRIIVKPGIEDRLFESLELASRIGNGNVVISSRGPDAKEWTDQAFGTTRACGNCGTDCGDVEPKNFSFNSPFGACAACNGLGAVDGFDIGQVIPDRSKSVERGAIVPWVGETGRVSKKQVQSIEPVLNSLGFTTSSPLEDLSDAQFETFARSVDPNTPGLLQILEKEFVTTLDEDHLDFLDEFRCQDDCPSCDGSRLNAAANSVYLANKSIAQFCDMSIADCQVFVGELQFTEKDKQLISETIVGHVSHRLKYLAEVGLGYLSLSRSADSLSGGELQRVRLAKSIGNGLTGACYVLDEPTVGLHARDSNRLINVMNNLKERGNSLVVVEHDDSVMRASDHLIEIGPGAGPEGGAVVFEGTFENLVANSSGSTGPYLSGAEKVSIDSRNRSGAGDWIRVRGASGFNLKAADVDIPLGQLCCVTGVSGSGKTTLIGRTLVPSLKQHLELTTEPPAQCDSISGLEQIERLVQVDQRPLTRTPRGCAATYTGLLADIRRIYSATKLARQLGLTASSFSFNSKSGRCPACLGHGLSRVSMKFLPDVFVQCERCQGDRFNAQTLSVRFRGFTVAEVLAMSVNEAKAEFHNFESMERKLSCLADVGLGYLKLGQPSTMLSGGESQRIKLAAELAKPTESKTLYVLDEPTTGLQFEDVQQLLNVLNRLVESGKTVLVIEHHLDVIKNADWVIDLGPEGGQHGGEVIAQGTPAEIMACARSHTGQALQKGTE